MPKAIDRLILFIKETGLSARQFDISIGTANGYTLRMHKNNASVGSDVIERIVSTYPQINLVWLITGQGDMFLDRKSKQQQQEANVSDIEAIIEQKINAKLSQDNNELVKRLLEDINKEIEQTKNKN